MGLSAFLGKRALHQLTIQVCAAINYKRVDYLQLTATRGMRRKVDVPDLRDIYMRVSRSINWTGATLLIVIFGLQLLLAGCGEPQDPIQRLSETLKAVPTFSIVLDDMREEGNFFKDYYHKYQILFPGKTTKTDWMQVSEKFFQNNLPFLGMTIYVKEEGKVANVVGPPGYEYVGNSKYGSWQRDSSGNSFWVFYGQYAMLSHLLGGGPIYRRDYNSYHTYASSGRPYYGSSKQYGTNGSYTKKSKPNFYSRRMSSLSSSKSTFSDKVKSRTGRTKTSSRGRSGRSGK